VTPGSSEPSELFRRVFVSDKPPQPVLVRVGIALGEADGVASHRLTGGLRITCPRSSRWRLRYVEARVTAQLRGVPQPGHRKRVGPKKLEGHREGRRTRAVFDRYHIVSPADLRDAARKLRAHFRAQWCPRG
jgi:hypothetical protein